MSDDWKKQYDAFVKELGESLDLLTVQEWKGRLGEGIFGWLDGPDGRCIVIHYDRGRLSFGGLYPRSDLVANHEFGGPPYGVKHNTGCAMDRGALAVAKDVARRFLPDYETYWQKGIEERDEYEARVRRCEAVAGDLGDAWRGEMKVHEHDPVEASMRLYRSSGGVDASVRLKVYSDGDSVELQCNGLSVEQARQVGLLLREMGDAERGDLEEPDPFTVLDSSVNVALELLEPYIYDPEPHVDGYDRDELMADVRNRLHCLAVAGMEIAHMLHRQQEDEVG